jgi:hypothetical protein
VKLELLSERLPADFNVPQGGMLLKLSPLIAGKLRRVV